MLLAQFISILYVGSLNRKFSICVPYNKLILDIIYLLYKKGYIKNYKFLKNLYKIEVYLRYIDNRPLFKKFYLLSKPGHRFYKDYKNLKKFHNKYGGSLIILSTSKGIFTSNDCLKKRIGGEPLFLVNF